MAAEFCTLRVRGVEVGALGMAAVVVEGKACRGGSLPVMSEALL